MPNQIAFYPQSSSGAGLPTATAAGQVPTSTGAGTTYTAQTPAMVLISKQVLAAPAAGISFPSIPQTFTHLKLIISAASSQAATFDVADLRFNADSTANHYIWQELFGANSTASAVANVGSTSIAIGNVAGTTSVLIAGSIEVTIPNYSGAVFNKSLVAISGTATSTTAMSAVELVGVWNSTAAITQIDLLLTSAANFIVGSTFSLYGLS